MNQKRKYHKWYGVVFLVCLLSLVQFGCKEDFGGYYDYPKGLEGPIYQQLAADTTFREFVKAIDKLPQFKQAINTSGLYTAFAPTNAAVKSYLRKTYSKNSFDEFNVDNPAEKQIVQQFVDAHFVLDMYFEYNFNKNISDEGYNDNVRYFLRYKDPIYDYYDQNVKLWRKVISENKKLTVYTQKLLNKYHMTSDYEALFERAPGAFNVEGAQVLPNKKDIAAINGVIHGIDQVLAPRKNMDQLMEQLNPDFYKISNYLVVLQYSPSATQAQSAGEKLDSLFVRSISSFSTTMDLADESSIRTVFSPPVEAYSNFIKDKVLPGFNNSIDSIHPMTKYFLISDYILSGYWWSSEISRGVMLNSGDTIRSSDIGGVQMASNGMTYMLKQFKVPTVFRTVTKGPMLSSRYSWFYDFFITSAFSSSGSSNFYNMSSQKNKFTFFVPYNGALRNIYGYDITRERLSGYGNMVTGTYRKGGRRMTTKQMDSIVNYYTIPDLVIHPDQLPSIQNMWIETNTGNYIQIENGKLEGSIPLVNYEVTENGVIYYLNTNDIPLLPRAFVTAKLFSQFPNFYAIVKNNMVDEDGELGDGQSLEALLKLNSEMFTVFIPTDEALKAYKDANGLGDYGKDKKWGQVAKYLITKTRVYTDGTYKQDEAAMNPDPKDPTMFTSLHKKVVYLDPAGVDQYSTFKVTYSGNEMYVTSSSGETAKVVSVLYNNRNVRDIEVINGVLHPVDKVLAPPVQSFPDK